MVAFHSIYSGEKPIDHLLRAIDTRDVAEVTRLIANGVNVNEHGAFDVAPIYLAAESGQVHIAELLLKRGADVNACSFAENTPLYIAAERGNIEMVRTLLAAGANVNPRFSRGETALHRAAIHGDMELAGVLIQSGAGVNYRDCTYGRTPLHWAAHNGYLQMVKLLLDAGADIAVEDCKHHTAHMLAVQEKHAEIAALLEQAASTKGKSSSTRRITQDLPQKQQGPACSNFGSYVAIILFLAVLVILCYCFT